MPDQAIHPIHMTTGQGGVFEGLGRLWSKVTKQGQFVKSQRNAHNAICASQAQCLRFGDTPSLLWALGFEDGLAVWSSPTSLALSMSKLLCWRKSSAVHAIAVWLEPSPWLVWAEAVDSGRDHVYVGRLAPEGLQPCTVPYATQGLVGIKTEGTLLFLVYEDNVVCCTRTATQEAEPGLVPRYRVTTARQPLPPHTPVFAACGPWIAFPAPLVSSLEPLQGSGAEAAAEGRHHGSGVGGVLLGESVVSPPGVSVKRHSQLSSVWHYFGGWNGGGGGDPSGPSATEEGEGSSGWSLRQFTASLLDKVADVKEAGAEMYSSLVARLHEANVPAWQSALQGDDEGPSSPDTEENRGIVVDTSVSSTVVCVADAFSGAVVAVFRAHGSPLSSLSFGKDGTALVTACVRGHAAKVWALSGPGMTAHGHAQARDSSFTHSVVSGSGQHVTASDEDGIVLVPRERAVLLSSGDTNSQSDSPSRTIAPAELQQLGLYLPSWLVGQWRLRRFNAHRNPAHPVPQARSARVGGVRLLYRLERGLTGADICCIQTWNGPTSLARVMRESLGIPPTSTGILKDDILWVALYTARGTAHVFACEVRGGPVGGTFLRRELVRHVNSLRRLAAARAQSSWHDEAAAGTQDPALPKEAEVDTSEGPYAPPKVWLHREGTADHATPCEPASRHEAVQQAATSIPVPAALYLGEWLGRQAATVMSGWNVGWGRQQPEIRVPFPGLAANTPEAGAKTAAAWKQTDGRQAISAHFAALRGLVKVEWNKEAAAGKGKTGGDDLRPVGLGALYPRAMAIGCRERPFGHFIMLPVHLSPSETQFHRGWSVGSARIIALVSGGALHVREWQAHAKIPPRVSSVLRLPDTVDLFAPAGAPGVGERGTRRSSGEWTDTESVEDDAEAIEQGAGRLEGVLKMLGVPGGASAADERVGMLPAGSFWGEDGSENDSMVSGSTSVWHLASGGFNSLSQGLPAAMTSMEGVVNGVGGAFKRVVHGGKLGMGVALSAVRRGAGAMASWAGHGHGHGHGQPQSGVGVETASSGAADMPSETSGDHQDSSTAEAADVLTSGYPTVPPPFPATTEPPPAEGDNSGWVDLDWDDGMDAFRNAWDNMPDTDSVAGGGRLEGQRQRSPKKFGAAAGDIGDASSEDIERMTVHSSVSRSTAAGGGGGSKQRPRGASDDKKEQRSVEVKIQLGKWQMFDLRPAMEVADFGLTQKVEFQRKGSEGSETKGSSEGGHGEEGSDTVTGWEADKLRATWISRAVIDTFPPPPTPLWHHPLLRVRCAPQAEVAAAFNEQEPTKGRGKGAGGKGKKGGGKAGGKKGGGAAGSNDTAEASADPSPAAPAIADPSIDLCALLRYQIENEEEHSDEEKSLDPPSGGSSTFGKGDDGEHGKRPAWKKGMTVSQEEEVSTPTAPPLNYLQSKSLLPYLGHCVFCSGDFPPCRRRGRSNGHTLCGFQQRFIRQSLAF